MKTIVYLLGSPTLVCLYLNPKYLYVNLGLRMQVRRDLQREQFRALEVEEVEISPGASKKTCIAQLSL